ncbi:MAG: permease [Chitinivibrionales bacterium]|nr:permease [Chitinivibrionales bacterium]MBD3395545.1 permease [Chitinivibrionales bacterium]
MGKGKGMIASTIIMGILAVTIFFIALARGEGEHIIGLKAALRMTLEILPLLVLAFLLAGLVQALLPGAQISSWIGEKSGLRGILLGTVAGALTPGGPFVSMPLAAGFLKAGAGMGTMVAFMTSWSLLGIHRMPLELGILGWRFMLVRILSTALFAPLAGLLAVVVAKLVKA